MSTAVAPSLSISPRVQLTARQRAFLEQIARRQTSPQRLVMMDYFCQAPLAVGSVAEQRGGLDYGQDVPPVKPPPQPDQGEAGGSGGTPGLDMALLVQSELCVQKEVFCGKSGMQAYTEERLLTNDMLTLAVMEQLGVTVLATYDDDFDAVAGLTVCKPFRA